MKNKGSLLVLSGPSGAGKSTVIAELMKLRQDIAFSVSCTTRAPRPGETDGVNYYFVTEARFDEMVGGGEFLEHARYAEHSYGTPRRPVEELLESGKNVILDIEVQGAEQVRRNCPEAVLSFLLPPSFEELSRRLHARGTEDEETIQKRLARAKEEYPKVPDYDYLVINDDPARAAREIDAILTAAACRPALRSEYYLEVIEK